MTTLSSPGLLASFSSELAGVVERAAPSVVRIDDGSRLTATGLIWAADGLVVTTSHGVERDHDLTVEGADGSRHIAALLGRDADTDLALLRVEGGSLTTAPHAPPESVKVGQLVLALGRPGTVALQATLGIINARLESQTGGQPEYILNTDAVLYPGFSGGPLVDMNGQVVGVVNRLFGRGASVALGTPLVSRVVEALRMHGNVRRGYLGIRSQLVALPEGLKASLNLAQDHALLIVGMESGSAAEKGGLMLGDTLLHLNDQPIEDVDALRSGLRAFSAGQEVALRVVRGGAIQDVTVTLGTEI